MENIGKVLNGKIISFKSYGVFVKTKIGIGMIHISEITDGFVKNIEDFFTLGNEIKVKVLAKNDKRFKYSYKQVPGNNTSIEPGFRPLRVNLDKWTEDELKNK